MFGKNIVPARAPSVCLSCSHADLSAVTMTSQVGNMRSCWKTGIFLFLCYFQPGLCDLTCLGGEGGGDRACDWSCQLRGRQGECRRGLEEDLLTCTCFGDVETGLDLFEDVADGDDDDDEGSLPYFLKQIIFLRLSQSYLFRSRERLLTPEQFGLENAENFYISSGNGTVGAWYLWPDDQPYTPITSLDGNSTIIVYMHGNSLDRGLSYRVALYKVLTSLGLHVITFDYRAYGDSSMVQLTEETVVSDGKAVLSWVTGLVSGPAIIVWGHSLGTAVATRVVAQMGSGVQGLLLESPFNKMEDEVNHFSVARWTAWAMGMVSRLSGCIFTPSVTLRILERFSPLLGSSS